MAGGFGSPAFSAVYGSKLGPDHSPQSLQTGGPDYSVSSMAGGTGGAAPTTAPSGDEVQMGFLGMPLTWWIVILGVLVLLSLMGGRR